MALFGGQVGTTGYQAPDYSGSIDAARGLAMTRAQGVASGINQVTDYFKQQGEKKKLIKQSDVQIDAALKLFPDLSPTLQGVRDQIKDENISLDERAQIAETVAGLINMGTNQMQSMAEVGLKNRELDIRKGQGIQEALAKQAELEAQARAESRKAPVLAKIPVARGEQTVQWYPDTQSFGTPTVVLPDGVVDEGVAPMDIPTVEGPIIPANEGVVSEDGQTVDYLGKTYTIDTGVLPSLNSGSGIQNAISMNKPTATSRIGFLPSETKSTREAKVVSGNEAKALNLDPTGTYEVTYENGKAVGYKPITAPKAEKEIDVKDKESALRAAGDAAYAITTINALTSSPGFSGVFGAKAGSKFFPGTKARNAESLRKAIVALATTDSIKKFQGLGSMSNSEFAVAQSAATRLEDSLISDEEAAEELNRLRSYFAESIRRAENLGKIPKGSADKMITDAMANPVKPESPTTEKTVTPKTATDQLRAMQK